MKKKKIQLPKNIKYSQPFSGIIVKSLSTGMNAIELDSQNYYQHQLNQFEIGERVTMIITNKKSKRTDQQNKYYWGVYLPLIAEETGERDLNKLHELFKGKFLTKAIEEVLGEKVRIKKSTTRLSTKEFTEYISAIENLTGVQAPPTDNDIYYDKNS